MENQFITIEEARKILGISRAQIDNYTHRKLFPYYRPTGRKLYFKKEDLYAFIEKGHVASVCETEQMANEIARRKP
jgi:excisionase family DNA binding protein